MNYCYDTMKELAAKNSKRMKISIDEFVNRLDIWFFITDSPDELEEIVLGLMSGLSDEQIAFCIKPYFTKKQMATLRIMISNGASNNDVKAVASKFKRQYDRMHYISTGENEIFHSDTKYDSIMLIKRASNAHNHL